MNRQETDKEARATKNVKNVWKWIVGVGIALSLFAWMGGLFNHGGNAGQSDNPAEQGAPVTDSANIDNGEEMQTDTMMESVRGTK